MFSARLHWDLQPNSISKLLAVKRAAGIGILDLTESNPSHAGLAMPADAIVAAFADPAILRYSPDSAGLRSAREAVAAYYGDVDSEQILLTTSTSEAYSFLFKLLTDPGDEVLVPQPSYPLFDFLAGLELVRVVRYPLVYHGDWEIDFEALTARVGPKTRALVLVNPNNPTGSFLKRHQLDALVDLCRERQIAIISDEVFADYAFGEDPRLVHSLRFCDSVLTFCLSGLSKVVGLPQMKLGWMVVSGPQALRAEAFTRLELIADTYLSVGTPVQVAAPKLLAAGRAVRQQIRDRTARNLAALRATLPDDSPLRVLNVEAGWYAILEIPRVRSEEEWTLRLLEHYNVLVQPGFFYDFESEGFLVVSLLTPETAFDQGTKAIAGAAGHAGFGV